MSARTKWESLTAVVVVEDRVPSFSLFQDLSDKLAEAAFDSEIIIVANGVSDDQTQALRELSERLFDTTVHFLAERIDPDSATLIGLDHATSDWVCTLTPTYEEVQSLPAVFAKAGRYEVVFAGIRAATDFPYLYRTLASAYFKAYKTVTGCAVEWPAPSVRVYSRAAARYLTTRLDGEFMIRSLNFSGAFPGTRVGLMDQSPQEAKPKALSGAAAKAFRGLMNTNGVLLRASMGTACLTGVLALISSLYTIVVYLTKPDVMPGWTTLSLQVSGMMFLFSIMFALVAEYVLRMYRTSQPRRRFGIVREVRSPLRRQAARLNVLGGSGNFEIGAPPVVQPLFPAKLAKEA